MDFEKIFTLTNNDWNSSYSLRQFEAINSMVPEIIKILDKNSPISGDEVSLARSFFLDAADYIGPPSNSCLIARLNSDQEILRSLTCCRRKKDRIESLQTLKHVGLSTSFSVLAFMSPRKYSLTNSNILCAAETVFEEALVKNGGTQPTEIVNNYLQKNYMNHNFKTALEMSAYLLFLYNFIHYKVSRKGITNGMMANEKFKIKINRFLSESP